MRPLDPRLLRASRSARGFLVGAVTVGIVRTGATIAIAWGIAAVVTEAIDADHTPGSAGRVGPSLALLSLAFLLRAAAAWGADDLAGRAAATVKGELRRAVLRRAAARGSGWLAARSSAGFATTLGPGLDALDAYFGRYLPQLVLAAVATPALVVAIAFGDRASAVIVVGALPVIPVFMVLIGLATRAQQERRQDSLARLGGAFLEAVEGLATLKVFGRARRQVARIATITDEYRRGTMRLLRLSFMSGFALELAASLAVALVAISIGVRLVDGSIGLGPALFVLLLAPEAFAPVRQVGVEFHAAADGVAASSAVLDVLDDDPAGRAVAAAAPPTAHGHDAPGRDLVIDRLTVVRDGLTIGPFSCALPAGTVTVLTGASGCGKSTLFAALRGTLTRAEAGGTVTVPGAPSLPIAERVTWMDQRPRLIRGTIAENVALVADPDPSAVRAALRAVGLEIDPSMPLGAGGSGLSGGQAQRVALARAVLRAATSRTPLVLLDEPTSALDAAAEAVAVAAARRLADAGAVVVVASHRPAVMAASDGRLHLGPDGVTVSGTVRERQDVSA